MRIIKSLFIAIVAAMFVTSCGTAAKKAAKAQEAEINRYKAEVLKIMEDALVPALQVCYTTPQKKISFTVVNEKFYAEGDRAKYRNVEFNEKTLYEACSISKLPLGYLACRMADQGRFDMEKPLYEYRPDILDLFEESEIEKAKTLTGRICLTHTCGLDNKTYGKKPGKKGIVFKYPIGEYHYSGPGIYLVQLVLESLWGETLDVYSARELFKPLGMETTNYCWQPVNANLAPYAFKKNGKPARIKRKRANAAYTMNTTAEEFTKFMQYTLDGAGLSQEWYDQMLHRYVLCPRGDKSKKNAWRGLAWVIVDDPELGTVLYHTGSNGTGFKGNALALKEKKETLVYFFNGHPHSSVHDRMTKLFFGNKESISVFAPSSR